MSRTNQELDTMDLIRAEFEEQLDKEMWHIARKKIEAMSQFDELEAERMQKELEVAMFEDLSLHSLT